MLWLLSYLHLTFIVIATFHKHCAIKAVWDLCTTLYSSGVCWGSEAQEIFDLFKILLLLMLILKDAMLIRWVKQLCLPKQATQGCAAILVPRFLLVFAVDNNSYLSVSLQLFLLITMVCVSGLCSTAPFLEDLPLCWLTAGEDSCQLQQPALNPQWVFEKLVIVVFQRV